MPDARPYGWRGRIGMLKPSPVTDTNAHEFYLVAPPGVELFIASFSSPGMTQAALSESLDRILASVHLVTEYGVGVLIQAGIPHLAALGYGIEEELRAGVAAISPVPFVTDLGACIDAMRLLAIAHPVVVSPIFDDEMYDQISRYLAAVDIAVAGTARVVDALEDPLPPPLIPPDAVQRVARELYRAHSERADGIWIAGAAMPSVTVIDALERELGVPVISSAQAMMWAGLRAIDIDAQPSGFGRLLAAC